MRRQFQIALVAMAGIMAGMSVNSCASQQERGTTAAEPSFVGFVTGIEPGGSGDVICRLSVENHADKLVHRHAVTITNATVLLRSEGQNTRPLDIRELQLKDWVKLWFTGPAKKQYPAGVTARQLMVVDRP
jgi:hypothetical protein